MNLGCFSLDVRQCPALRRRRNFIIVAVATVSLLFLTFFLVDRWSDNPDYESPLKGRHPQCNCPRYFQLEKQLKNTSLQQLSTCGPLADVRGPHQRVVTFSFYGPITNKYFPGIAKNVEAIKRFYPGWVMRIYHRISAVDLEGAKQLCDLVCSNPILDECFVDDLDTRVGFNLKSKFGMIWRFVVLGDPLVDVFSCRDLDSTVHQREVDAVDEWLKSDRMWHVMRDHPQHIVPILGCGWGVKNSDDFSKTAAFRDEILREAKRKKYGYDELLLAQIVFPEASKNMMSHDSYSCSDYADTQPFPTRRIERTFVGATQVVPEWEQINICPVECRPRQNHDWFYC